ncbi:Ribonuclease HI [Pseudobythopirellula maris]|uniref:Ribonuclease HI n=1 Tax=Pseudobythopirellula maris TaxID=2527991 RepID=A0A5C5ZSX5_9BACT|nr:RNase H family protein [Pseudobythopirellula maris]TWT90599.1 Ribonuclease HI [Pseudobythopirellula maris]
MHAPRPRYLLFADTSAAEDGARHWRFALHGVAGGETVTAGDAEQGADRGRLELLAAVRGLEALGQPSDVTLLSASGHVVRGVRRGLREWRNNHWRWERFGRVVPIRDCDLWRRIDRALAFHRVTCRLWRVEPGRQAGVDEAFDGARRKAAPSRVSFTRTTAARTTEAIAAAHTTAAHPAVAEPIEEPGRFDAPAILIVRPQRERRRSRFRLRERDTLTDDSARQLESIAG